MSKATLLNPPVRDLQQNWEIDVAAELDAYLNQLEAGVQDDSTNASSGQLNFIEAALLLQSGTSVYSRKVEYLRTLTYQTLQNFAVGRRDATTEPSSGRARRHPRMDDWDISDTFFVPWNAVVPGKDIDEQPPLAIGRQSTSCGGDGGQDAFVSYFPYFEGSHVYPPRVPQEPTSTAGQRIPLLLAPRDDRAESRLASAAVHPTLGILLVDPQDIDEFQTLLATSSTLPPPHSVEATTPHLDTLRSGIVSTRQSISGVPLSTDNSSAMPRDSTALGKPPGDSTAEGEAIATMSVDVEGHDGDDDITCDALTTPAGALIDTSYDDKTHDATSTVQATLASTQRALKGGKPRLTENPLALLDCHKPFGRDRPMKIGITSKPLRGSAYVSSVETLSSVQLAVMATLCSTGSSNLTTLKLLANTVHSKSPPQTPSSRSHKQRHLETVLPGFEDLHCPTLPVVDHYTLGPTWVALEAPFGKLQRARQDVSGTAQVYSAVPDETPNDGGYVADCFQCIDDDDTASHNDHGAPTSPSRHELQSSATLPRTGRDRFTEDTTPNEENFNATSDIEKALLDAQRTYSGLERTKSTDLEGADDHGDGMGGARHSLELFNPKMSQAQLHARMAKWRAQVEEWLQSIEKRGLFDVAEYKNKVATHVQQAAAAAAPLEGKQEERATFASVIDTHDRSSVCRTFLTVLMMCYDKTMCVDSETNCLKTEDGIFRDFDIALTPHASEEAELHDESIHPVKFPGSPPRRKRRPVSKAQKNSDEGLWV